MNGLFRLRKDMRVVDVIPLKHLIYTALLSDIVPYEDGDIKYAVSSHTTQDLYDYFHDWETSNSEDDEVYKSLNELSEEGFISFDDDQRIYLGEFRGKKFFPFEVGTTSKLDSAIELLNTSISIYGSYKSTVTKSRARFIRTQFDKYLDKGIPSLNAADFTEIHGYLYEIYTGGEIYTIRNKVEYYQTNNMLKAYDKQNTFIILVNGTLRYDTYRKNGLPTLTNVACMKDDVFRSLVRSESSSKEYMREVKSSINSEF